MGNDLPPTLSVELPPQNVYPDDIAIDQSVFGGWGYGIDLPMISYPTDDHRAEAAAYKSINKYEQSIRGAVEAEYPGRLEKITKDIEAEVLKLREQKSANGQSELDKLLNIRTSLQRLNSQTTQQRNERNAVALAFDGLDPTPFPIRLKPSVDTTYPEGYASLVSEWAKSYQAAYDTKVYDQALRVINQNLATIDIEIKATNTYRFSVSAAATLAVPGQGTMPLADIAIATLRKGIADAIAALGRIATAGPGAPIAAALGAVFYSSSTANEQQDQTPKKFRYGLSLQAQDLGLSLNTDLNAIAAAQGSVALPYRLTNETRGDGRSYVSVVTSDGMSLSKRVPVHAATLDPQTGSYNVAVPSLAPDHPPITLTWTPAAPPGDQPSTTTSPIVATSGPAYTGVELLPLSIEAETYPGVVIDPDDFIIWFPAESGIEPIYVMLSEPLDSGIFTRRQLDKKFKHAVDFGILETRKNRDTLTQFRDAIEQHLNSESTVEKGTYLREPGSKIYFNPSTNLVVILGSDGTFVSGWRLTPGTDQFDYYIENEVLW